MQSKSKAWTLRIDVLGLGGFLGEVVVGISGSVLDLKYTIQAALDIPVFEQQLVIDSQELRDCDELQSFFSQNSTVTLIRTSQAERTHWRKVLEKQPLALARAPEWCKSDPELVHTAVLADPRVLEFASLILQASKRIVLDAVRREGLVIRFSDVKLRGDLKIVRCAVRSNPQALKYASADLRRNKSIVLQAVRKAGLFEWNILRFASDVLQNDADIIRADNEAFMNRWKRLNYLCFTSIAFLGVVLCPLAAHLERLLQGMKIYAPFIYAFVSSATILMMSFSGWVVTWLTHPVNS